jgi:hypothetical protein
MLESASNQCHRVWLTTGCHPFPQAASAQVDQFDTRLTTPGR